MEGNPGEDAQSSAPSESFHTIPIYNIDASSDSDSDNSDRFQGAPNDDTAFGGGSSGGGGTPAEPQNLSIMSQRTPIQPPIRSYTVPVQHTHQRQNSDLAESVQTRPSIDEELLFEDDEESEEEVYDPGNNVLQLTTRPTDVITLPKTPVLVASPGTTYETPNMVEVPDIRQRMETGGLRPLSLLSGSVIVGGNDSQTKSKSAVGGGRSRDIHGGKHSNSDISKKEYDSQSGAIDEKYRRRSKELDNYRDSSDLLPLTLGGGGGGSGNAGGLIFATNYAYLAAPFGRVISRNQIMSRVVWFSTLVFFNMIYAGYKLIHSPAATTKTKTTTTDNQIDDGKSDTLNFMFLVILPVIFLVLYVILVTIWTYLDLRNKDFDPTFTVLYYSPLMLFSLFFKEKKRVDVSEFHEVNYGAQWWKFGTSRVREGLVMTLYSLLLMCFVLSDLISSAVGQPNAEVSEVFKDFVPISFMLVVFFMGFVLSIWGVVEAVVGGGILGSGEGRKRLVGVLPYAFKRKKSNNR